MIPFQLTIIGAGSAIPTVHRAATSQLLRYASSQILIDCAEGTQIQMKKLKISAMRIERILISHLHGDHYFGLIGLITSMHLLGRDKPLFVYGPPELIDILMLQLKVSQTKLNYPLVFAPLNADGEQLVFEDNCIQCFSFPVVHRIPTWGFRFDERQTELQIKPEFIAQHQPEISAIKAIKKGADYEDRHGQIHGNVQITLPLREPRSYAFCTDTAYHEGLLQHIKKVNLLYHEATFLHQNAYTAATTFHSTAHQAALMAKSAEVKQLIIGHFSSRYTDPHLLLEEARSSFPNSHLALDGSVFDVE